MTQTQDPTQQHRHVVWITPDADIRAAAVQMACDHVSSILVGAPGELISILTERDLAHAVAEGRPLDTLVSELAVPRPYTIDVHESLEHAGARMIEHDVRHLVLTRDGRAVGVISMRDVVRALLEPVEASLVVALMHSGPSTHPEHWWG